MWKILTLVLLAATLGSQSPCLYVPDAIPENTPTLSGNTYAPLGSTSGQTRRSMLLVPAIRFANVPRWIDDVAFVWFGTGVDRCDELIVRMSHTTIGTLSNVFADNITEPPVEVLRVRNHRFSHLDRTWTSIGLQHGFQYIPGRGDLLIEFLAQNLTTESGYSSGFAQGPRDQGQAATAAAGVPEPLLGNLVWFPKIAICSGAAELDWFGSGCIGSGGQTPSLGLTGDSGSGGTVSIWTSNAPAATGTYTMLGVDNGAPFPTDLAPLGMTGCQLYFSPLDAIFASTNASGIAVTALVIPTQTSLVGAVVYAQALVVDPTANPAGITATNYGRIQIGR